MQPKNPNEGHSKDRFHNTARHDIDVTNLVQV